MTHLLPNLGGEEGPGWRALAAEPAVRTQARLWRLLFPADSELLYDDVASGFPEALGAAPEAPVFPWLASDAPEAVVPWIVTEDARRDRRVAGRPLHGPAPDVVAAVHDKAFAHGVARDNGLVPSALRGCVSVLEPEALRADDAADRIDAAVASWPGWARARFTLKPRLGSSGRGRVAGRDGRLDRATLGGALERLAGRGGALLEPWLQRSADFSVQLHVDEVGVTLLGSLEQLLSDSGRYLGHRGELDSRGRVFTGHAEEETLREAAALVAVAAREAGYAGPCGVDAFRFHDPDAEAPALRPIVELNARFTAGLVVIGLVRRALPRVKAELGLRPGERLGFRFLLGAPDPEPEPGPTQLTLPLVGAATLGFSRTGPPLAAPPQGSGKSE